MDELGVLVILASGMFIISLMYVGFKVVEYLEKKGLVEWV